MQRTAHVAAFALLCWPSAARADLPPPDGLKYVGYSFTVTGLAAAGDRVLFAYPCGGSSGAPVAEHQKLEEGRAVSVGRRGGNCTVYAISKASYDAFLARYKPTNGYQDPALDALAKGATKCAGGPTPTFQLATSDPRSSVNESLAVRAVTETQCALTSTTPTMPAVAPKSPSSNKSCSVGRGGRPLPAWGVAGLALAALGVRRGRRARGRAG
ncbi:MAG TPA: hypothetical protein VFS43_33045 [Polyangiaceae bacterium]|nr:hypothetical protein [Polyangiaceae bacterium]